MSLCSPKQLKEYMVMQVDHINDRDRPRMMGPVSHKVYFVTSKISKLWPVRPAVVCEI